MAKFTKYPWQPSKAVSFFGAVTIALPAAAVPPPPEQVTANCVTPTYASDQLVCGDSELLALDTKLAEIIDLRIEVGVSTTACENDQDWFRRSRLCAFEIDHRDCLRSAYCARIELLKNGHDALPPECNTPLLPETE